MRESETSRWEGWWPRRTLAASVAVATVPSAALVLAQPGQRGDAAALLLIVVGALLLGGWLFFGAWTWRRVSRAPRGDTQHTVWRTEILRFGGVWGGAVTFIMAAKEAGGFDAESILSARMAVALILHAVIVFPFALWAGYLWGSTMHGFPGPRRQP